MILETVCNRSNIYENSIVKIKCRIKNGYVKNGIISELYNSRFKFMDTKVVFFYNYSY